MARTTQLVVHRLLGAACTAVIASLAVATPAGAQTIEAKVKPARSLYQIALSPSTDTLYVASVGERGADNAKIVVLDADTLATKDTIELGAQRVFGIGLNESTQTLYGTLTVSGEVVAIDVESGEIVATMGDGEAHVREVRIDEASNTIYVSVVGTSSGGPNEIWIIDGESNTLRKEIEVDSDLLTGIAIDKAGNRAFATGMRSGEIAVVDLDSGETVEHWPAGGERPTNAAFDASTGRLFVTNQGSGTLTVLDTSDGSLIETIETGEGALDVKLDASTNRVYVTNRAAGTTTVVDATSYDVTAQIETGTYPQTVAIHPDGERVYVSNKHPTLGRNPPPDAVLEDDPNGDTVVLIDF